MTGKQTQGHLCALMTMLIWGTTFISTKILLREFSAIQILLIRFVIGFLILFIIYPKRLKVTSLKHELTLIGAGLCGICLYYLLENIALIYTSASNVGVIISIAPFFTALLSHLFFKSETKLTLQFFIGFFLALTGILLININDLTLSLHPLGDLLAVLAAFVWAVYSLLTRKINSYGYHIILTTRRTFLYGILFMLPFMISQSDFHFAEFYQLTYLGNLIYLGAGASALCFVTWNFAVKVLGTIKSSVYIYAVPVITVLTSALILKEQLTLATCIGTILTLSGLLLSENKCFLRRRKNE